MNFRIFSLIFALSVSTAVSAQLTLEKGDTIAFIGNALPDRLQHDGWLETYIQKANPDKQLVIRNMGFTGDQVASRPRNENFMNSDDYLTHVGADVIFAFFGYNESFSQDPEAFKEQLERFIDETRAWKYNGESAPRIVLFSPIAREDFGSANFPDAAEGNKWLSVYTDAMASVARRKQVPFVDLYYTSQQLYEKNVKPLTINSVHLNNEGNRLIASAIVRELFGDVDLAKVDELRQAVLAKNWCWFNRYRATDGNDIWGSRAELKFVNDQTNEEVLQHELLMLDIMTANRDKVIWAAANGRHINPDDSNVPKPIQVMTNLEPAPDKRAPGGGHTFVKPEDGVKTLKLEKGMVANLFASEQMFPEFVNPVQMDVDTKGRLWVAAWQTYPKWQPDHVMKDRLLILPDENRDGVADKAITFAYIHNPTGFTFWNGGVIVASAPDFWFLKDTNGDDIADIREVIMSGEDSADTHHAANGFDFGPDGYLYYQRGIFIVSNVETPWGPARPHGESAMYRFNPRTHRFALHAVNPPNAHGGDFDYWGHHFATSATGGEAYQVRMDGDGKFKMHELLKKTVRPVPSSGILSSQHFPEKNNGNFIILNSIGFLGIKQYTLEYTDGKVWGTETDDLLVSSDTNFRPTDFKVGDDGALYVADWSNPIIGHMQHNIRDPNRDHDHGRIYRITVAGRPLQKHVDIDGQPIAKLLDVLKHPTDGVRLRARIELSERDTAEVIAAAQKWAGQFDPKKKEDAHHLLEALWLHQQFNVVNEPLLNTVLESPEPEARRAAERVKYMWNIEGKFDPNSAAAPKHDHANDAEAALAVAREYLKQEPSPEPRMDGDVFELHIQTIKEQMRYDRAQFTVSSGMKVRLIFTNPDAMDHNLIMTEPGAAARVTFAALKLEEDGTGVAKQWRPDVDGILFASRMLAHGDSQIVDFTAPKMSGDYEYLCTFPGHSQLMRGVMHVVPKLDGSIVAINRLTDETAPEASDRQVVAYWQFGELSEEAESAMKSRSFERGKELFRVAACNQCHTIRGEGRNIGPDLSDVYTRFGPADLLQQIIDPSVWIPEEYKSVIIETANNREYFGLISAQDDTTLTILENPLQPETAVTVKKTDIKSTEVVDISPMPTDLLITLEREEIWDLLAYVLAGGDPAHPAFK